MEVCEPGWEKFQSFCYRHFTESQNWEAAEQHCRMCGGHLLSVMTPEEEDYISGKTTEEHHLDLSLMSCLGAQETDLELESHTLLIIDDHFIKAYQTFLDWLNIFQVFFILKISLQIYTRVSWHI